METARTFVHRQAEYITAADAAEHAEATLKYVRAALESAEAAAKTARAARRFAEEKLLARDGPKDTKAEASKKDKPKTPQPPVDKRRPAPAVRALANFCQMLMTSNEFLYID